MSFSTVAATAARLLSLVAIASLSATLTHCGSDGGISSFLPPGPSTTSPPGNVVLYVAQTLGSRIDAYRLGTDGLMPAKPFDTIILTNPRRLTVANGVLYASLFDRIVSIKLGADGSLPNLPTSTSLIREDYAPVDLEVQGDHLYVAVFGLGQVESYPLDDEGNITFLPDGVGQGQFPSNFASLALNGDFLYSGARQTQYIDVFLLTNDGRVPAAAEQQDPQDNIALADDIVVRDNILYVTSASDRSIRAYRLEQNAFVPPDYDSRTKTEEYYEKILLVGNVLYAAAYNAGRIDLFTINPDGMLPENKPFYSTKGDPGSFPISMVVHGGILYVAQGGLDRVDAYVLDGNGVPTQYPSSSTSPTSETSYPLSLAIYELP